jgi:CelD/BcsL family acetyltransferase involved in cellulose biosynthesis
MGIEVTRLDSDERDEWNQYVERTPEAMAFHRHEALTAVAEAADARLHLLCGRKGQEPVGLLPLFETTNGPLRFVHSPPPEMDLPYLGPILLNSGGLKRRKAEQWHRKFVDGCVELIDRNVDADLVSIRTIDRYPDVRPFLWNDFEVEPAYTYVVGLAPDEDDLLGRFSSGARRNVRDAEECDYAIEVGDRQAIRRIVAGVRRRVAEHGDELDLDADVAVELYDRLPEGCVRPYVCRVDGEYAGGILTLERGDTVYRWQGGAKPDVDFPVNEVLDWTIMRDAKDRDRTRYDLVGAMIPQLCEYKAKFGPEPRPVYVVQRRSRRMEMASAVYDRLPSGIKSSISF